MKYFTTFTFPKLFTGLHFTTLIDGPGVSVSINGPFDGPDGSNGPITSGNVSTWTNGTTEDVSSGPVEFWDDSRCTCGGLAGGFPKLLTAFSALSAKDCSVFSVFSAGDGGNAVSTLTVSGDSQEFWDCHGGVGGGFAGRSPKPLNPVFSGGGDADRSSRAGILRCTVEFWEGSGGCGGGRGGRFLAFSSWLNPDPDSFQLSLLAI